MASPCADVGGREQIGWNMDTMGGHVAGAPGDSATDLGSPAPGRPVPGSRDPGDPADSSGATDPSAGHLRSPGSTPVVVALWGLALAVTAVLVHQRYTAAVSGGTGGDFEIYLGAAREVAAGHSAYVGDGGAYVYPPTLALVLAPFTHLASMRVFRVWTLMELLSLVAAVACFVAIQAPGLRRWQPPVLFGFCAVTVLHFWPLTLGLFLGQADAFVLVALMASAWAAARDRPVLRGVGIGVAALLKAWPGAVVVSAVQRGAGRRVRVLVGCLGTVLVAPVIATMFGGVSGLGAFVRNVVAGRSQHLVSDSVWGVPAMLFTHSGLARPLTVSPALHVLLTVLLVAWVVTLLVLTLRTPGDPVLCTWNVTFCLVLLLPVSHLTYAIYGLPVLWVWASRLLRSGRPDGVTVGVTAVLLLWWVVLTKAWSDNGSPAVGALHLSVVFGAGLVACTVSVLGGLLASATVPLPVTESGTRPTTVGG